MRPGSLARLGRLAALLLILTALATAQEEGDLLRIEIAVTAVSGRSVYLEPGRDAGLEPGDRVRLFPAGQASFEVELVSVSRTSARAELPSGARIEVGTEGEARVPRKRIEAEAPSEETASAGPEHPPWTRPPEEWNREQPLLAPLSAVPPKEREVRMRGRTYLQVDSTWDREGEDTRDVLLRTGLDASWENLFGRGGELVFDGEFLRRQITFGNQPDDETENFLRLQRLSYAWGGTREERRRWQVGRFLPRDFPEFGRLDGAAWTRPIDGDLRAGVSAGFLTSADAQLSTGDDTQIAAWLRRDLYGHTGFGWGLGLQKTWHEFAADRDLLAGNLDWRPAETLWVSSTALVDFYGSGERAKSPGPELTEAHVFGSWRPSRRGGVSFNLDQVRWPDIRRTEFVLLPPDQLRSRLSRRVGTRLWREVVEDVRLSARVDLWKNEDASGTGGDLRADWSDPWEGGRLSATWFMNDGEFSSVSGLRLRADGSTPHGTWSLGYELTNSDQTGFQGADQQLAQQALRASWDMSLGSSWSLSIHADQLFGDAQDATTLGFFLQRRL